MSKLWSPNEEYTVFDPNLHSIEETYGLLTCNFLPYQRNYETLSNQDLLSLIQDTREHRWQALDLRNCGLEELPDELWELPDLKLLWLGNDLRFSSEKNTFPCLPRKIEQLTNLQVLSLSGHPCAVSGTEPLDLPNLLQLDLLNCAYEEYPLALLIPSLVVIVTPGLKRPLPDAFCRLTKLEKLYIFNYQATALPAHFGNLAKLKVLSLSGSHIEALPASMAQLRSLRFLNLVATHPGEKLPPELRYASPEDQIRYLLQLQGDVPREYFNESKMVIVGQAQVGKSSLLERLVYNAYHDKPSTEGIQIDPWHFLQDGEEYRLNIWDFGGQEIYHATHQFFLTRQSLYILVWDALSEDEYGRVDYWLRTIQSFADDSPIFIVVNKCDSDNGRRKKLPFQEYQDRYPQIEKIFEVSCRDNLGIDELRDAIQERALKLPLMKTPWISTWLRARQALEALVKTRNHIPYEKYEKICRENGVEQEDIPTLALYLHNLGVILHYRDDLLLKDMVILSAEWGTDAVYKVLDQQERQLKGRNGILKAADLPIIWEDQKLYPTKYHPHLLNLMENFQLSFELDRETYLVAELLNGDPIGLDLDFSFGQTLSFRYDYDFMPAGIMTRFIVSAHAYLEDIDGVKQCWKKGAYLRHGSAYAQVVLNDAPPHRHIFIRVGGPVPRARQELLTIIRQHLDKVNSLFQKIDITRRIPCCCRENCPQFYAYEDLLEAETIGVSQIQCQKSWRFVDLRKLLDGVENTMEKSNDKLINIHIENNPTFTQTVTQTTNVAVSAEVKDSIDSIYGALNALCSMIQDPEFAKLAKEALDTIDKCNSEKEIKRSGALERLKNCIMDWSDEKSDSRKLLSGIKFAGDTVLELGKKYNKLAGLIGGPVIPLIGT